MTPDEQLSWEARQGRIAAGLAFANVVLACGAGLYTNAALSPAPKTTVDVMRSLDSQPEVFVVSDIVQGVALLLLIGPFLYLLRATKARLAETPDFLLPLLVIGPVLLAAAGLISQFDQFDNARDFLASGPRTEERADDLIIERGPLSQGLGLGGSLAFAVGVVVLSLRSMAAGLLSRLMGTVGIVVGALFVLGALLPTGGAGFVQLFWILALAALFLGRWPGGRGPAWSTVAAIPWPSAQQRRDEVAASSLPVDDPRDPEPAPPADDETQPEPHPVARKRSRKRRR